MHTYTILQQINILKTVKKKYEQMIKKYAENKT